MLVVNSVNVRRFLSRNAEIRRECLEATILMKLTGFAERA